MRARAVFSTIAVIVAATGFTIPGMLQPKDPDLRLVLNIPASRLDVYENGVRTHSYEVSAGAREFATPPGGYRVREIIWNPWWHPPKSEWARKEKPAPPGPANPMGRIKINFAPAYYIHGTVWEDHLGAPASHGCVRMGDSDLLELAHLIHKYRTPRVDPQLLATLEQNREITRSFPVRPVAFDVVYQLVEVIDGKLVIHPDVYRQAGTSLHDEAVKALQRSGYSLNKDADARLRHLKPRKFVRITVPLDSLLASAGD